MMIKVFELNKNKKIELTKEELEKLLNQAYWEGYYNKNTWTYTTPNIFPVTTTTIKANDISLTNNPYTIKANDINSTNSITIKG